jgi:hypothetical protein
VAKAPIAAEVVARIDQLFAIERLINGHNAEARLAARVVSSAPILAELESWLRAQRERTSRKSEIGKAIDYTLSAGSRSPASWQTAGSASATTPSSEPCAASRSAGTTGPSPALIAAANARPQCTHFN